MRRVYEHVSELKSFLRYPQPLFAKKLQHYRGQAPAAAHEDVDPVDAVLRDLDQLDTRQQDLTAQNLALLWRSFHSRFDGAGGFIDAARAEQEGYLHDLTVACNRLAVAKGTDKEFYLTSLELMRNYVAFMRAGGQSENAIALAKRVVPLIDRGQQMLRSSDDTVRPEP